MSGEKILIIDDRRENLVFLAESVLRPEGYRVITAMDGKQGLDKALAEDPDLIITDLKMPRLSGLELIAALRKARRNIPVILTTFYGSEQAAIEAFRLGARDYIVKPYEIKDMLDSVERALIERRLQRETARMQAGAEVIHHLEGRVRQLHSLCGIGKAVTALHAMDEILRVTVEAAIYLTDAAAGQFFLVNPQTQQVEVRAVRGPSDSRARCFRQAGADPLTMQALQGGKAVVADDAGPEGRAKRVVAPLQAGQKTIGALAVDAKSARPFDENDRYLMGLLADFAAVAVVNARLIAELREQAATTDQTDRAAEPSPPPGLGDSVREAERLSRELRDLAAAAQVLAARLQVIGGEAGQVSPS